MNYILIIIAAYILYYVFVILLDISKKSRDTTNSEPVLMDFKESSVAQEVTDDDINDGYSVETSENTTGNETDLSDEKKKFAK